MRRVVYTPPTRARRASEVRREAASLVRDLADERELDGDPECAGRIRDTARLIEQITLIAYRSNREPRT